MDMFNLIEYLRQLFKNHVLVAISAAGAFLYSWILPVPEYKVGAVVVFAAMLADLGTKLYAIQRKGGGWRKAIFNHLINSASFLRGTIDKLIVFGVMTIICGLAYHISLISSIAVWFTQMVYILMFLRDALSVVENLTDSGIGGLGIFKKLLKLKIKDYVKDPELQESIDEFLEGRESEHETEEEKPKEPERQKAPEPIKEVESPKPTPEVMPELKEPAGPIETINLEQPIKEDLKHDH